MRDDAVHHLVKGISVSKVAPEWEIQTHNILKKQPWREFQAFARPRDVLRRPSRRPPGGLGRAGGRP